MTRYSPALLLSCACALPLLAGCDAVGEGVAPTGVSLEPNFRATGLSEREAEAAREAFENGAPFAISECLPAEMQLVLEFDNGARENATRRSENVRYSSSDESVLEISNRDIPFIGNPDQVFPRGALIPRSPGTATVTASFSDFEASMEVEVQSLGAIDAFAEFPEVIAPNSFAEVLSDATVNGQTLSVSNAAALRITDVNTGEESEAARVQRTGDGRVFVRGVVPSAAQQAELDFELCDKQFTREFRVEEISELQVSRATDDGEPLAIGFSELLDAKAVFDGGEEQVLTDQVVFSRPDEQQNLLLLLTTTERSNSLLLPLSGQGSSDGEDDDAVIGEGTGGMGSITAAFQQQASGEDLPDGVADLPETVEGTLDVNVRPGRAEGLRWRVEADSETGERRLRLPQDCQAQPGVEADINIFRGQDDYVTVTREVGRGINYFVGEEPVDDENGNDQGAEEGDAAADEADPVIRVQPSAALSGDPRAGTITAVGEVGEEEVLRAVLVQNADIPGFEDNTEDGEIRLEDQITVEIIDRSDCADFEGRGVLE